MISEAEKVQGTPQQKKTHCEHEGECMKLVQLIVDGQATEEQMAQFKNNMAKCLPCENGYELEKCIKDAMQLRIEKKCVPTSLIDCIKKKISSL